MKKPGDTVERYVVDAMLGAGGMGEVYEARDTRLGRKVALKLLRPGAGDSADERMLREARAAAAFEHPNVVVVYDVGEADGARYIAMELVRGRSMRAAVGDAAVPVARRLRWLVDVARALAAAHRAGLVHRDIKPDNVMVRDDGAIKVLDFGIARRTRQVDPSAPTEVGSPGLATLTAEGVIVGTPLYAAPEQLRAEDLDGRADQFAWGVTAYELLTGAPPWTASDAVGVLAQILSAEPAPLRDRAPAVPVEVDRVVLRALAKRPADRFADLDEVADALEPHAEAAQSTGRVPAPAPIEVAPAPAASAPARRGRRALRWGLRIAVGLLALPGALIVGALVVGALTGKLHVDLPSRARADAARPVVEAIACTDAKVDGPGASPAVARAVGVGACARVASEIGVDWRGGPGATPLVVTIAAADGGADVSARLELAGRSAVASGSAPLDAVAAAVAELAHQVDAPPVAAEAIAAWGAKDAASARRIERVWRRMVLNLAADDLAEIKAAADADPESPWPPAFEALAAVGGSEALAAAADRAIARVGKLPASRALGLRGLMTWIRSPREQRDAYKMLRQAYVDAPDDADIAGLYAAVAIAEGAGDEGFAVVDRLYERFPTRSIVPLNNAVTAPADRDLARDARYLGRLFEVLPEAAAWGPNAHFLARSGRFDEARAALAFARAIGLGGARSDRTSRDAAEASLELSALAPARARELAVKLLADPRLQVSTAGADLVVASYVLEGRLEAAEEAALRELDRQVDRKSPVVGALVGAEMLAVRRLLGRPPLDAPKLAAIEGALASAASLKPAVRAIVDVEIALARARLDPRKARDLERAALDAIDAAAAADEDRQARDALVLASIPLARAVLGERDVIRRWREATRGPTRRRARVAAEAGLALEAAREPAAAEQAYALAMGPDGIEACAVGALVAMSRMRDLHRAAHRDAAAAEVEATLARLLAGAEPGVVDALRRAR